MKTTYVVDTSVLLHDSDSIKQYEKNDIVIPLKVLEEIDKHKKRQDLVGSNARASIKFLDSLRTKGNLQDGVQIEKGMGTVKVVKHAVEFLSSELDRTNADNHIISVAMKLKNDGLKVILVSRDINMRVIADALGLDTEDFSEDKIIEKEDDLYSGFETIYVEDEMINDFYDGVPVYLDDREAESLFPNQFVLLTSEYDVKKTALTRFIDRHSPLRKVESYKDRDIFGIKPKNKEQMFALDLLMDPDVKVVSLVGKAGAGKTLIAIACGLEQVIGSKLTIEKIAAKGVKKAKDDMLYKRLIVSRPVIPMGRDIGFLPGDLTEKILPWLTPIQDNLRFLTKNDQSSLKTYIETGVIELEALTYIRGRSISNAFIVIDEAQNLSKHEIKTILTRVGEGTKIILTGDIEQIDNVYLDETTNGLVHAVENFKGEKLAGHVTLKKGERSEVATVASKVL